jgi:hypothetical protein
LGWRDGYLSDPYKRVLINQFFVLPDTRPDERFEQLVFVQWTHFLAQSGAGVEVSYRYGHNDFGSESHTGGSCYPSEVVWRTVDHPSGFSYYRQSAADFYDTSSPAIP